MMMIKKSDWHVVDATANDDKDNGEDEGQEDENRDRQGWCDWHHKWRVFHDYLNYFHPFFIPLSLIP